MPALSQRPLIVLGAGATKACGGPLTAEILPKIFQNFGALEREGYLSTLDAFLCDNFRMPSDHEARQNEDYPGLPLLLSLIDTGTDRKQPFRPGANLMGRSQWGEERLADVRAALEYAIFALLDYQLRPDSSDPENVAKHRYHPDLLQKVFGDPGKLDAVPPIVISLNYDLIIDNAMIRRTAELFGEAAPFPDYRCDIRTEFYNRHTADSKRTRLCGRLLKLHGSLNFLYCPACHRLDIGVSQSDMSTPGTEKVLNYIYREVNAGAEPDPNLHHKYACRGVGCEDCGTPVEPILITPTHRKDYRNPHISRICYEAERELRQCDRVIFLGYSLPDDDVEVIYLFKRGLSHLPGAQITVVGRDGATDARDSATGNRYRVLFGDDIDWQPNGMEVWLQT